MVRFALDIHLLDSNGNCTCSFVTIKGDCLSDIFKNIAFRMEELEYARLWYITQSVAELEEHGEGWWNWVNQWYLSPSKLDKLMKEVLC